MRLICFPYAGGGASMFRKWPNELPQDIEIAAVQLPGRENRIGEPPFKRLDTVVEALACELNPYLDISFAFYGHSMGALIGFELVRRLQAIGPHLPRALFVSGCRAPQIPDPELPLHEMSDAAFLDALRDLDGTPDEVLRHQELMELVLPTLRADFEMTEEYVYRSGPPLACPISAYGGREEPKLSEEDVAAWGAQTLSGFSFKMFPGWHFFIRSSRTLFLRQLARDLRWLLDSVPYDENVKPFQ